MKQRNLIILVVIVSVLVFLAGEADQWTGRWPLRHQHYNSTLLTSFRLAYEGDFELDDQGTFIVAMSPDASLRIRERVFTSRRRLEVKPDESGRPVVSLEIGSRQRSEADAQEYLSSLMPRIMRVTTIGARARAASILAAEGLDALLSEVTQLDSNAARSIYLEEALGSLEQAPSAFGASPQQAASIIHTAAAELTSSSRLGDFLIQVAKRLPAGWDLGADLAEAASHIPSSGTSADTLIEIARLRPISSQATEAFALAAADIGSSSAKARAMVEVFGLRPSPELASAFVGAVDSIASSGEIRRVLDTLMEGSDLTPATYSRMLRVVDQVASSGEAATILAHLAYVLPDSEQLQTEAIQVAGSISSSGSQQEALMAVLGSAWLSADVCRTWVLAAGDVASSGTATDLLVESTVWCPSGERLWRTYIEEAEQIPSSGDQRRALAALLARHDLTPDLLDAVDSATERSVASLGDREYLLERLEVVRREVAAGQEATQSP